MSERTNPADPSPATAPHEPSVECDPHRVQISKEMIASNIDPQFRVAPALGQMSVINEIYSFAERLRAGSLPAGEGRD